MKKYSFFSLVFISLMLNGCVTMAIRNIEETKEYYAALYDSSMYITNYDTNFVNVESLKTRYNSNDTNKIALAGVDTNNKHTALPDSIMKNIDTNARQESTAIPDTVVIMKHAKWSDSTYTIIYREGEPPDTTLRVINTRKILLADDMINKTTIVSGNMPKSMQLEAVPMMITAKITSINADYFPDSVIVNATVTDSEGSFISGLASPYLPENHSHYDYWTHIVDSCKGIANKIQEFDVQEVRQSTSPPYSICYVLDHSPSMGNQRTLDLQQSVRYVSGKVKEGDYLSAIKFTSQATVEVMPTDDKEVFNSKFRLNAMATDIYGAGTDILKAVDSAIAILKTVPEEYKRVIVLFTDGQSGTKEYNRIVRLLKQNKIRVFTICYGLTDISFMKRLAKDSDGKMFMIRSIKEFPTVFNYIYNTLSNYYKITYKPPTCADLHNVAINMQFKELDLDSIQDRGEYDKSLFNNYIEVGTVTLMDIEFEYNKSTISAASFDMLKDIANQLSRNESIKIRICGHTDDKGSDEYNMKLSLDRANAVKNELVKLGVEANRLAVKGYGKTQPIAPNDTEENRHRNRRTEFIVVE